MNFDPSSLSWDFLNHVPAMMVDPHALYAIDSERYYPEHAAFNDALEARIYELWTLYGTQGANWYYKNLELIHSDGDPESFNFTPPKEGLGERWVCTSFADPNTGEYMYVTHISDYPMGYLPVGKTVEIDHDVRYLHANLFGPVQKLLITAVDDLYVYTLDTATLYSPRSLDEASVRAATIVERVQVLKALTRLDAAAASALVNTGALEKGSDHQIDLAALQARINAITQALT